jgi:hypothetical protein
MKDFFDHDAAEIDERSLMAIVVGAHLESELSDRALAYRLRESILEWQANHLDDDAESRRPVVCCDLWYLNTQPLRLRPTISLGRPETNAATAFLSSRLPTAFVVDDAFRIQFDPELIELKACIWGLTPRDTAGGLDCFIDRYLGEFLDAVHAMPTAG